MRARGCELLFSRALALSRLLPPSYALDQATEWQDIAKEALKAVVVMLVLERLFISSPVGWIEDHIDYLAVQAVMLREELGLWGRICRHVRFTQRSASPSTRHLFAVADPPPPSPQCRLESE